MESTAAEFFGRRAADYDSLIRRCVPRYDEMQERLVRYLPPAPRGRPERILELGAGTGNLSLLLAAARPDAELVLVDASPEMLSLAEARLAALARPVALRTVVARFEDLPSDLVDIDLVTSSISLHHVRSKATLYADLGRRLAPGGVFCFADQLRGVDRRIHGVNWDEWLAFCGLPGNCTPDEVTSLLDHAQEHDHYTPLEEHFALLAGAGFRDLDCLWRNWIWGIVSARRPD